MIIMEKKKLKIRDLTLRDGQQSLFATRLSQREIDKLLPYYENAGFYIMEVWGGAVPDSVMRYLDESPWDRLRTCSQAMKGKSLLSALSRGRNLFGYVPYPDYVLEGFYKEAIANGLNVMRIFDALNDIDNVRESIRLINELGGIADGAVCYTVDPKVAEEPKKGFFRRLFGKKAVEPEKLLLTNISLRKPARWRPSVQRLSHSRTWPDWSTPCVPHLSSLNSRPMSKCRLTSTPTAHPATVWHRA